MSILVRLVRLVCTNPPPLLSPSVGACASDNTASFLSFQKAFLVVVFSFPVFFLPRLILFMPHLGS